MNLPLKMRRKTTADLILNGMPVSIFSIEFDSTGLSKEELMKEITKQFGEVLSFKYHEQWVKP